MPNKIQINVDGVSAWAHISYETGGQNVFSGAFTKRGYYLYLERRPNSFIAHTSVLSNPQGASKQLIKEVSRQSKKTLENLEANLENLAGQVMRDYINYHKSNHIPIYYDNGRYE